MRHMASTLHPTEDRARQVLNLVAGILDLTDKELGQVLGISRATAQSKRTGGTRITLGDVNDYAEKLDMPAHLFAADDREILHWFADNLSMVRKRNAVWRMLDAA